jgi:hypothetical protein
MRKGKSLLMRLERSGQGKTPKQEWWGNAGEILANAHLCLLHMMTLYFLFFPPLVGVALLNLH